MNDVKSFISNPELLEENHKVDDLLDFSIPINAFIKRLETISKPSIVGLVGKYGSGKSTMLYQIQKEREKDEVWINFDAWKYPDRKDLWEGFVIDFAEQLGEKKSTIKKIDGESSQSEILDVAGKIAEKLSIFPGFNIVIDFFKTFIQSSPVKRVFELQEILTKLINKINKPISIVVEDIDRSGDAGIYFLETMKQFIQGLELEKKFIVIVPISDENYNNRKESYLKTLDYIEYFLPKKIDLERFVNTVFENSLFKGEYKDSNGDVIYTGEIVLMQVISFLEYLVRKYPYVTIRYLKLLLRKANQTYRLQCSDDHYPDFRVTLCIEASKFIENDQGVKFFDEFVNNNIIKANSVFAAFILIMVKNKGELVPYEKKTVNGLIFSPYDVKFTKRESEHQLLAFPSYPWGYGKFEDEKEIRICDFYLSY